MSETINREDLYLFQTGKARQAYLTFGCHYQKKTKTHRFTVWAPNAKSVSVVGDFNFWNPLAHPMKGDKEGSYTIEIEGLKKGDLYKYYVEGYDGICRYKSDPFAFYAECRPDTASKVWDFDDFKWSDKRFINQRKKRQAIDQPMSIYELHLGTWRMPQEEEREFYNYREIADMLIPYLQKMGYTHVELMGIAEHPFDGSWGYQVTGYYAPTRRYGNPDDFMYFVDYMHDQGIGVILDWVPAHFPKDAYGLGMFDGQPLYEHPDPRRGEHPHWGTYIFNYNKREVSNFLLANGLFWMKKFHVDGLRVDAVASMLYLDYGKDDGEWLPNEDGGNENYDAINLFRHMNSEFEKQVPGCMIIAEESTAWPKVSTSVRDGGLGFTFKWNMGWMNDFLEYMHMDPLFRSGNHGKLTFSMDYAYSENFIQVLSHDEVVHGKGSMINKMPGELDDQFANLRAAYGFMYGHPGKKLLFMGQEFAQYREWSESRSLDWYLLGEERNKQMQAYVKALNALYRKNEALYVNDYDIMGFEWMSCLNADQSTVSFVRRGKTTKKQLLFVCNFTPVKREDFRVGVPCSGEYSLILTSDDKAYGGTGVRNAKKVTADKITFDGRDYSIKMTLPPLSVTVYQFDYK